MKKTMVRPIGVYQKGKVIIDKKWAPGLKGLEGFSHVMVFFWLDKAHKPDLFIHPRGKLQLPKIGFLATRTPHRPNPLGFAVVKLLNRQGAQLWIKGFDGWDGTPILDVKPYTMREVFPGCRLPGWVKKLDKLEKDPLRRYGRWVR